MKQIYIGIILLLAGGTAMATEEPRYEVVRQFETFELRRYAPQLLAETEIAGEFDDVGNRAFRILADFIFGNNQRQEKISMTAPVSQRPTAGEKIAMTAPVTQTAKADGRGTYVFSFVMPAGYTLATLPQPVDSRVRIREAPAKLVAARRYSGTWSEARYREHESMLRQAVTQAGLAPVGAPVYARYNSPFSLWFLRRNEVLIEVAGEP
jgi:hypothetical protein